MERADKAMRFAEGIATVAANQAVIRLCAILAAKGTIDNAEVEAIRHLHLHSFDSVSGLAETPGPERKALEEIRAAFDSKWGLVEQVQLSGVLRKP